MTNKLPAPTPASAHLRLAQAIIAPPLGLTRAPRRRDPMPDIEDTDPDWRATVLPWTPPTACDCPDESLCEH